MNMSVIENKLIHYSWDSSHLVVGIYHLETYLKKTKLSRVFMSLIDRVASLELENKVHSGSYQ
jgi:hypothetical protein